MIEFKIRATVGDPETYFLKFTEEELSSSEFGKEVERTFAWPILPRIDETMYIAEGIFGDVVGIDHFIASEQQEIVVTVQVSDSDYEELKADALWS